MIPNPASLTPWHDDWIWSVPLILLTALIHVSGLGLIGQKLVAVIHRDGRRRHLKLVALVAVATVVFVAIVLHALEAGIWAVAYLYLSALPDLASAMLYSLGAMTTYGHDTLILAPHWRLMGAMEALNGMLLFGLSTAFLFEAIQRVSPYARRWRFDGRALRERANRPSFEPPYE